MSTKVDLKWKRNHVISNHNGVTARWQDVIRGGVDYFQALTNVDLEMNLLATLFANEDPLEPNQLLYVCAQNPMGRLRVHQDHVAPAPVPSVRHFD